MHESESRRSADHQVRSFGEWPSPITAELLVQAGAVHPQPVADGSRVLVERTLPGDGRTVRLCDLGAQEPLSPLGFDVGSRVHEYGGGAYGVRGGIVVAVEEATQVLWRLDGTPRPLVASAPEAAVRWTAPAIDPTGQFVIAVREDHRGVPAERPEPVDALVRVPLDGTAVHAGDGFGDVLRVERRDGTGEPDFVIDPVISPNGRMMAWVQWDHPNMPWDAAEVWVGDLGDDAVRDARRVAGVVDAAAFEPVWVDYDRLAVLDERTGWVSPYLIDIETGTTEELDPRCGTAEAVEYGAPPWVSRTRTMVRAADGALVAVRWIDGFAQLTRLAPGAAPRDVGGRRALADALSVLEDGRVVLRSAWPDKPSAVVAVDPGQGPDAVDDVLWGYGTDVPEGYAAAPEPVSWTGADGDTAHGFLYRPRNPACVGPEGELPPLVVLAHGGPTAAAFPILNLRKAYWTSRGIAVLDVNYAGSTGFGRAYRQRLDGRWGDLDVVDCVLGAQALADRGIVDRTRLASRGGSAGGFITLAALTFHDVFTAGLSSYGISDLTALIRDTHKFESQYPYRLIGPWPQARQAYEDRSPINHLDRLAAPLLLLQGTDDKVVPPSQAHAMAEAVRAAGLPVALVEFAGEGHGFRDPGNAAAALRAETAFLARVWGYRPAEELPPLVIDNLDDV